MFKKILFTCLAFLMALSTIVITYRFFEPKETTSVPVETTLTYESLNEYLKSGSDGSTHYLFFYSTADSDSIYVKDTVMAKVESETRVSWNSVIETVDITTFITSHDIADLVAEWGILDYPSFLEVSYTDGELIVVNKLEWNDDDPITSEKVIQWLNDVGLYSTDD